MKDLMRYYSAIKVRYYSAIKLRYYSATKVNDCPRNEFKILFICQTEFKTFDLVSA